MYDIKGKQKFIFKTNRIKEIIGGSCIIRDCFKDYLYPAAVLFREYGPDVVKDGKILCEKYEEVKKNIDNLSVVPAIYTSIRDETFLVKSFMDRIESGSYLGEVVYDGGGNFLVLYKDEDSCKGINMIFSKLLMMNVYSLQTLCTYITIDGFDDYKNDEKRLRRFRAKNEFEESNIHPVNSLPIVQVDRSTSMPVTQFGGRYGRKDKVSTESYAKLVKYKQIYGKNEEEYGEQILDKLVENKGEESLLAVIFIDGNNMRAKVESCLRNVRPDYESSINALRRFSSDIQKKYVDDRKKAIEETLKKKYAEEDEKRLRFVVFAGDEMSFICNARDAYDAQKAYFEGLESDDTEEHSSCAGIAIFHSHAPYSEAYKIAEECCENAKRIMKENHETGSCYFDYHYCQSGLGESLEQIRKKEIGDVISKPWLVKDNSLKTITHKATTIEVVHKVAQTLYKAGGRSNIKSLVEAAKSSLAAFDMEMSRIYAHLSEEKKEDADIVNLFEGNEVAGEERRRIVYDIGIVYDIWINSMINDEK